MAVRSHGGSEVEPFHSGFLPIAGSGTLEAELEFRQLEYFLAVAEELHFGRAASRVYISQPALSQAIAGLERTLDVQLFARTRQNVELTDAGSELLTHARGLLADREETVAAVRRVDQGTAGVLRVGVALLAEHEVAPAFNVLSGECQRLLLDRTAAVSERLLASLQKRELHAAVVHQVPVLSTLEGIEWEVLRTGRLAAMVSSDSPLADCELATLADLGDERFMVPPRELAPSAFEGLKTMCRTYGDFEPDVLEMSGPALPLGSDWGPVIAGEAIALMAEGTARATQPEGTAVLPLDPPPQYWLALAWRPGNGSPLLHRFLDLMRTYRDEHEWAADPVPAGGA